MATRPACMVCKTVEGKYKCPHCYLYSCSLACSKQHHMSHPPVATESTEAKSVKSKPVDSGSVPGVLTTSAKGISSQENNKKPGVSKRSDVVDTPEYKALLRRYPNLKHLLWEIANATEPPIRNGGVHGDHSALTGALLSGPNANENWTKDMGYENAILVLRQTRDSPGDDRNALREYCEIVRVYNAEREKVAAANSKQELVKEDAKTISNLLRAEKSDMS
ncbi:hypothetical protein F4821DRAFT_257469 [Hypoxylon rubiginosum]|uniref:Uncharacterized protein n=1 Tax=Hypoxylon rubiginosum TaxID=110542 RepID=A0ACC0D8H2_9PEZI|nr:hypothetical protein F4821DRAFT_257469 [Hypoxylon rubiginosum]